MLVTIAIPSDLLPLLFRSRLFNDVLTIPAGRCVWVTSLYQFDEELPATLDAAVFAWWIVFYSCRLSAIFSATHSLPSGYVTVLRAVRADVFVNKFAVSFFDAYAFAVKPFFTWAIACDHPSMIVTLSANTEYLAVVVATSWRGNRRRR